MDLRATITPKSDQLNADDLVGGAKTIRIRAVKGATDEAQPISIYFDGDENKPYKPCKSMRRLLVQLWGYESDDFVGRSITLYRDDTVKFAGVEVGGIRISHASHIDKPTKVLITTAKSKRRPITIEPLVIAEKKLPSVDFNGAVAAIKAGKATLEQILKTRSVTDAEKKALEEVENELKNK